VLSLADVSGELERLVRHLEPCGMGNPSPVFGVREARLEGARRVGANHLKGFLNDGTDRLEVIGFQWADRVPWVLGSASGTPVDVAFRLETNDWMGEATLQARLVALSAPEQAGAPARG
jgi:single-stranded-DNA-specific exonuclease